MNLGAMNKVFEIIYWIKIFLSLMLVCTLIILIIGSIFYFYYWLLLLYFPATLIGFYIAERARKKYGTTVFWSKTMDTPDIEETN